MAVKKNAKVFAHATVNNEDYFVIGKLLRGGNRPYSITFRDVVVFIGREFQGTLETFRVQAEYLLAVRISAKQSRSLARRIEARIARKRWSGCSCDDDGA